MYVVTDYTETHYITAGKKYPVLEEHYSSNDYSVRGLMIIDDDGDRIYILTGDTCSHLDDKGTWTIVE